MSVWVMSYEGLRKAVVLGKKGLILTRLPFGVMGQCWPLECQGQIGRVELKDEKRLQVPFGDLGAVAR